MEPIEGFKSISPETGRKYVPPGGYVVEILSAEVKEYGMIQQLVISFDIAEGPYKGFFAQQYEQNPYEDKRWKGTAHIFVKNEANETTKSNAKRHLESFIGAVEHSNFAYKWKWDEHTLIGKHVGVVFRKCEWEMNGRTGWRTECGYFTSASRIRNKDYQQLPDKPLKHKASPPAMKEPEHSAENVYSDVRMDENNWPF